MGHKMAEAAVEQYEMRVSSTFLSNCDSGIDLTEDHITRMQNVQDNYFRQVFQVAATVHGETRQSNTQHKIPNNNENNQINKKNHGQRKRQYIQESPHPRSIHM